MIAVRVLLVGIALCATLPSPTMGNELASIIDRRIAEQWNDRGVVPAPQADDAEYFRRLSLDLTGRIPSAADVRAFMEDPSPEKRQRVIRRLVDSPAFARHWASILTVEWVPQASDPVADSFRSWLEGRLRARARFDTIVREILTAPIQPAMHDAVSNQARGYLVANDFKPENLAANSARQFLGLNLECAQCHNHPFARWTQDQFWELAAFYDLDSRSRSEMPRIAIPGTEKVALARVPGEIQPKWQDGDDARTRLLEWTVDGANPYFARNAVNRLWEYFLGAGLIEPLDDLSGAVEPSHPELLDELARAFVASGYDVRAVIAAIVGSRPYGLSSREAAETAATAQQDPQLFARMPVRSLSAEQLFDSLLFAARLPEPPETYRLEFLSRFRRVDRRAEPSSSVLESLMRMNGPLVGEATSPTGPTVIAVTESPLLSSEQKIDELYLIALGRRASDDERQSMAALVQSNSDERQGIADVLWVLLNSAEFALNH